MDEAGSGGSRGGGRSSAGLGAGAALAGGVALLGCSLVLDFSGSSGGGGDAAVPDAGPPEACRTHEPNDELSAARTVAPGPLDAGICPPSDRDFFRFSLAADQDLALTLSFQFDADRADLGLRLYRASDGSVVESATAAGSEETIRRSGNLGNQLEAGTYVAEVFMAAAASDPEPHVVYDLSVEITDSGAAPDAAPPPDAAPSDAAVTAR